MVASQNSKYGSRHLEKDSLPLDHKLGESREQVYVLPGGICLGKERVKSPHSLFVLFDRGILGSGHKNLALCPLVRINVSSLYPLGMCA